MVEVTLEPQACEAVEYALMEAGSLGTESRAITEESMTVIAYFDKTPDLDHVRAQLYEALRTYSLPSSLQSDVRLHEVEDRDWLAEWKKDWRPVEVGRFIVAPPWSKIEDAHDRDVIRIDPGMAFGTGTHETTRLCLKAIDKHFKGGSFLDVGTGTGILAIAAAKLYTDGHLHACDTDPSAVAIARENARLNDVADQINFRVGSVNEQTPSVDLVCANLTATVILELLPELLNATCGHLILSGILDSQIESLQSRLREFGLIEIELEKDGEWIALVV